MTYTHIRVIVIALLLISHHSTGSNKGRRPKKVVLLAERSVKVNTMQLTFDQKVPLGFTRFSALQNKNNNF